MAAKKQTDALVKRATETALTSWEAELAEEARNEKAKETQGVPRITHRGGEFKIDGQSVGRSIKLAVVDVAFEKSYYEGAFDPTVPATPDCYAFGNDDKNLVAHPAAPHKQNLQPDGTSPCNGCKWNAFNTADVGRGKRCKDYRRLMVLSPTLKDGKPVVDEGTMKGERRMLQIPPGSLKNWAQYLGTLKGATRTGNVREGIVEVSTFALQSGGHGLKFDLVGTVPPEVMPKLLSLREGAKEMLTSPYPTLAADENAAAQKEQSKRVRGKVGR